MTARLVGDSISLMLKRLFMPTRPRQWLLAARLCALALVVAALPACALFGKEEVIPDDPADKLYNEGLFLLNNKRDYKQAAKRFEEVDRQHPYSEWARKALIMSAYAHYEGTQYEDSVTAAKRYVTLHPGSPDAAYAQFLIASSYFDQIPDITRDQQRTEKALQALDEVVRKYPNTEYAAGAKRKIEIARDQLAGKEMDTARFYQKKRDYVAAINRFKVVITQYQTTRHVEEALMRLAESYMSLGIVNEAQTAAGGLEPYEDQGSWISRAFKKVGLG